MQSLNDTLNAFRLYSAGEFSRYQINHRMKYYHGKMSEFERDFYHTPINSNSNIKAVVREILTTLEIPHYQWGRYLTASLNVHDFFLELALQRQKDEKLAFFIKLLDEQHKLQWLKIFAGAAAALAALEIAYSFLKNSISIQEFITAAAFLPIVGLVFTAAVAIYSFYKNMRDHHIPLHQRFRDNFFLLADVALKFAAYSILIAAATTASPLSAILFVVAEGVSVLKEVVSLIQVINKTRQHPVLTTMDTLSLMQYKARQDFEYMKHRNAILINLFTAVVCAAIVGLWCFAPPSIIVTVAAIVAIGLVYIIKAELKKCNEASLRNRLLTKFNDIEPQPREPSESDDENLDATDDASLLPAPAAARADPRGAIRRFGMFAPDSETTVSGAGLHLRPA